MLTITEITTFAADQLSVKQRAFKRNPNAQNWTEAVTAMLVHQQAQQLKSVSYAAQVKELCEQLSDLPFDFWGEAIVRKVTGESIGKLIAQHV